MWHWSQGSKDGFFQKKKNIKLQTETKQGYRNIDFDFVGLEEQRWMVNYIVAIYFLIWQSLHL